jgi:hypothetical protein
MTITKPYLLSSSETGIIAGIKNWKEHLLE